MSLNTPESVGYCGTWNDSKIECSEIGDVVCSQKCLKNNNLDRPLYPRLSLFLPNINAPFRIYLNELEIKFTTIGYECT